MNPQDLRRRTRMFANRTRKFCRPYLRRIDSQDDAKQFSRASAAVSSAYSNVCEARSHEEFISLIGKVVEEANECKVWARRFRDAGIADEELTALLNEAIELCKIFGASLRTARSRPLDQRRPPNRGPRKRQPPNDPIAQ